MAVQIITLLYVVYFALYDYSIVAHLIHLVLSILHFAGI